MNRKMYLGELSGPSRRVMTSEKHSESRPVPDGRFAPRPEADRRKRFASRKSFAEHEHISCLDLMCVITPTHSRLHLGWQPGKIQILTPLKLLPIYILVPCYEFLSFLHGSSHLEQRK